MFQLGNLIAGIGGIAAAVVEEVVDVMGLEDLDQPLVLTLVLFQALELVTAGTESARGRMTQGSRVT